MPFSVKMKNIIAYQEISSPTKKEELASSFISNDLRKIHVNLVPNSDTFPTQSDRNSVKKMKQTQM